MQEKIKGLLKNLNKTQRTLIIVSAGMMAVVIIVSAGLYLSNQIIEGQISAAEGKAEEFSKNIDGLKKDKYVIAYNIISQAKDSINKDIEKSSAGKYLVELEKISAKYPLITFAGFSYNNGKISTSASAEGKDKDAIFYITKFIRDIKGSETGIFNLEPISGVSGDEKNRAFVPVTFSVK